ncbi:glycyl-tRNA synthetase [Dimargaris cristalligena]|uniref:Glycyl-tRNA synthetase n=1 Tax=Dimargaris cristalligena TaxID=215637 RepID=A0A4P9ZV57_9FUNG|nr:glycyl-tRNA synthetase [Dimargaris cristalligena]|eukprot:RKP37457.1 glycyl-tRNA synthetase [Dimargaris cristalligena]
MAAPKFDRPELESLVAKRFFYAPSFGMYGGVAGLYDYGPIGCALQTNILNLWRSHFVLEEDMLELDCSILTPAEVLKTSGHVDKFSDWMVKDTKNGDIYRADHLVKAVLEARIEGHLLAKMAKLAATSDAKSVAPATSAAAEKKAGGKRSKKGTVVVAELSESVFNEYQQILAQLDNFDGAGLGDLITRWDIRALETGNPVTTPVEFNLMFESSIGPTGQLKGYLRPETAQGQFLNFKRLLEFNNERVPRSVTKSPPRAGLLRVREFTMAEIEHFVDPLDKSHSRFAEVQDTVLRLLPATTQLNGATELTETTIGEAVRSGLVDNETLGYFLVRIFRFLLRIGINPQRLRFRQHMSNEMAHYACDCWDAEIQSSYGWIECVGCADRSAYDLTVHAKKTGERLTVQQALPEPVIEDVVRLTINKKLFGPKFKKAARVVEDYLTQLEEPQLLELQAQLTASGQATIQAADGNTYPLDSSLVTIERVQVKHSVREFTPNVIEPSFGIGRILYSLIEHSYWTREDDEARAVLSFPTCVAPFKCLVLPLSNSPVFTPVVKQLASQLRGMGIAAKVDDSSASIGKRYARNDELGTPFAITVDFQTVKDETVTLRERDSTHQIRQPISVVLAILKDLISETKTWEHILELYPLSTSQEA